MHAPCRNCGSEVLVIDKPSVESLYACEGFLQMKAMLDNMSIPYSLDQFSLGMCTDCSTSLVYGPPIRVEGNVQ